MSKFHRCKFLWFNFTSCPIEKIIQLKVLAAATCMVIKTYILSQSTSARDTQKCFRTRVDLWSITDQLWSKGLQLMQKVRTCSTIFSKNSGRINNDLNLPLLHSFTTWIVHYKFRKSVQYLFLQNCCTALLSWALVYQHLGRPTTWPVLFILMYHQLFSGCTPVMALQWPMVVASQWGLREPLAQPPPSPSHSTLCTHPMEDSTPASQQLTHLHQQWLPQGMWLSKVSIELATLVQNCTLHSDSPSDLVK